MENRAQNKLEYHQVRYLHPLDRPSDRVQKKITNNAEIFVGKLLKNELYAENTLDFAKISTCQLTKLMKKPFQCTKTTVK